MDITQQIQLPITQKGKNEHYKLFLEQAPFSMAMFDLDMHYLATSKKWLDDYGLSGQEIIGHSHYDIFPEIGDDWKAVHQACFKGEIKQCAEEEFIRADGSSQSIKWEARPWYKDDDTIGGLLIFTEDISLLKQEEQQKKKVESYLDQTNEVARIGFWEVDVLKKTLHWSKVIKEIFEVTSDYEPELESAINFFKEGESRQKIEYAVSEAIKNGTHYDLELEIITAKGKTIWVRAIGKSEFKNGVCVKLFGVFQAIDAMIKSKQALEKLNSELTAIIHTENVSIIATNNDGLITFFNKGAETLLQYDASEIVGIQTPAIFFVQEEMDNKGNVLAESHSIDAEGLDGFKAVINQKKTVIDEWSHLRKDGSTFPMQVMTTAILNSLGEPVGILGVGIDISNLKNAEQKLMELNVSIEAINRQLNQKNEEMEQFAYVAAHDLQEPLRMITSFLSLLEKKYASSLDDKGKEYIRYSIDGALRMRDLIRDILNFSKSGELNNSMLDLNPLLQHIVDDYRNNEKYQSAIIEIDQLPVINADPSAIQQLFTNLIGNGLKYQPEGNVPVIKLSVHELSDKWLFKIADNGLGIDPNHYDKVFVIFKRLHNKSAYSGTGIGLATCKKIVGLYNGDIWIEPNEGNGSVFCFTIRK